jgi:predicted exporter
MADWKQQDPFAGWETEDPFARKKYPIEGDSNWSILPEGEKVKYQTTDPETNARVEGTKSFNQFIPSNKHIPLSQAPKQALEKNPWDTVGALTQGTKEFVSSAVGMPVDVTNKLMGTLVGRPQGLAETPLGGSESISNAFKKMGITDYNYEKNLVNNSFCTNNFCLYYK